MLSPRRSPPLAVSNAATTIVGTSVDTAIASMSRKGPESLSNSNQMAAASIRAPTPVSSTIRSPDTAVVSLSASVVTSAVSTAMAATNGPMSGVPVATDERRAVLSLPAEMPREDSKGRTLKRD